VFTAGTLFTWTAKTAFAQADANAGNLRMLSRYLATDEARSVAGELAALCRSFPGGRVPTSNRSIAAGNSCAVLAAWDGRENPGFKGAVLFRDFWERALALPAGPWSRPFSAADPLGAPSGLDTASPAVQKALGDALADLAAAHAPYDVALGRLQFVVRDGQHIPLPGGPGDPDGDFNAIYSDIAGHPGADPSMGSSYMQVVTWPSGSRCPAASTLVTYSESASPASPHSADQTRLFSQRKWATGYFCPAQVAAHALSTTVLRGR
jgi:acyl-homoserine-lactone acylase